MHTNDKILCSFEGIKISFLEIPIGNIFYSKRSDKIISFLFFLSGGGILQELHNKYSISYDKYIIIHNFLHTIEYKSQKNTAILEIDISMDFLLNILEENINSEFFVNFLNKINDSCIIINNSNLQIKYFIRQIQNILYSEAAKTAFCIGVFLNLLEYLIYDNHENFIHPDEIHRIEKVKEILRENLEFPPSFRELASTAKMDLAKFTRVFKLLTGTTPYGYLRIKRLERAMYLLSEENMNVTDVTYAVGYSNISYFSKLFFEYYKIKPSELKNIQNK